LKVSFSSSKGGTYRKNGKTTEKGRRGEIKVVNISSCLSLLLFDRVKRKKKENENLYVVDDLLLFLCSPVRNLIFL